MTADRAEEIAKRLQRLAFNAATVLTLDGVRTIDEAAAMLLAQGKVAEAARAYRIGTRVGDEGDIIGTIKGMKSLRDALDDALASLTPAPDTERKE